MRGHLFEAKMSNNNDQKNYVAENVVDIKKVCILGAGQFGFALAFLVSEKHQDLPISMYDIGANMIDSVLKTREHPFFHKGVKLRDNVHPTHDLKEAVSGAQVIILSVPGAFLRGALKNALAHVTNNVIILSVAKSLEPKTNKFMGQVMDEEIKDHAFKCYCCALAGGMLAEEVTQFAPIAADVGSHHFAAALQIVNFMKSPSFKLKAHADILGIELAGCLKNVTAIGAGMLDGYGLSVSTKSAYISEAASQMRTLAVALGAQASTFDLGSHAWLGDVMTTCFGNGRNRLFGSFIGEGQSVADAHDKLKKANKISEGYLSTKGFAEIAAKKHLHLPILETVNAVLFHEMPVQKAVLEFFKDA